MSMQHLVLLLSLVCVPTTTRIRAYPARVGVQESPVYTILHHISHPPTPVEEDGEHSFPLVYYTCIFFCLGRLGGIVCHGVFLGYWRNDEGRM